jgi:hypothetical protein
MRNELGRKLREMRKAARLRAVEVAVTAGIQPSRLSLVENWLEPRPGEAARIRAAIERLSRNNGEPKSNAPSA